MKKIIYFFIAVILFLCFAIGAAAFWVNSQLQAPSDKNALKTLLIEKGDTAAEIAAKLEKEGLIRNELVFRLYVRITNKAKNLPVGEFRVPQNLAVDDLILFLKKGPQEVWVTIPEGLRREQLPEIFAEALNLDGPSKTNFERQFLDLTENDEGYLYPETYLVPKDSNAQKAVSILKNTFDKKTSDIRFTNKEAQVILASLLERETRYDSEKPMIAGILNNRLKIGMPLQVDATVQYAKANLLCAKNVCKDWWPTVYLDDYKLVSPYNTYQISALPPHPISSPGLASIKAAVSPQENDYFYYIHDKSGQVHFAKTLEEHNANVQNYLR